MVELMMGERIVGRLQRVMSTEELKSLSGLTGSALLVQLRQMLHDEPKGRRLTILHEVILELMLNERCVPML
jgi:hypothetical protein